MGSYNHIISHQVMSDAVPRGLDAGHAYLIVGALRWDD
jgi:hypothetical protein